MFWTIIIPGFHLNESKCKIWLIHQNWHCSFDIFIVYLTISHIQNQELALCIFYKTIDFYLRNQLIFYTFYNDFKLWYQFELKTCKIAWFLLNMSKCVFCNLNYYDFRLGKIKLRASTCCYAYLAWVLLYFKKTQINMFGMELDTPLAIN